MKTLTRKKLNKIFEEHKHWINKVRADLSGANLHNVDLSGTDLSSTNLHNANLSGTDLSGANLRGTYLFNADLRGTNLRGVNFRGANVHKADLSGANLHNADLSGTDLSGANLHNADLSGANLSGTDLSGANLHYANLSGTDLSGANLCNADLSNADLSGAKNVPYIPMACPEEGDFIGWKKAEGNKNKVIVKLHIPYDAKRSSATTRKCRCSKAEVIAIYNLDGTEAGETTCHSDYDKNFIYEVGKTVEVTDFSEDRWNECAKGIHFFINRQEAINY